MKKWKSFLLHQCCQQNSYHVGIVNWWDFKWLLSGPHHSWEINVILLVANRWNSGIDTNLHSTAQHSTARTMPCASLSIETGRARCNYLTLQSHKILGEQMGHLKIGPCQVQPIHRDRLCLAWLSYIVVSKNFRWDSNKEPPQNGMAQFTLYGIIVDINW